jgi:hypothetical protein
VISPSRDVETHSGLAVPVERMRNSSATEAADYGNHSQVVVNNTVNLVVTNWYFFL